MKPRIEAALLCAALAAPAAWAHHGEEVLNPSHWQASDVWALLALIGMAALVWARRR
jgi:hypothetical protein